MTKGVFTRILTSVTAIIIFVCVYARSDFKETEKGLNHDFKIAHPLILLTEEEEINLSEQYKNNHVVRVITDKIISNADSLAKLPLLPRKFEGKRMLETSRAALRRIFYLSYAYRHTKDSRYAIRAVSEVMNVCQYEDWNPSHFLDVAEMTMAIAIGYDWLYDYFTQEQRNIVVDAIKEKSFEPALDKKYSWFRNTESNWNPVCNSALIYGAIVFKDELSDLSNELIEQGVKSNEKALNAYEPDGCYPEGYGYWSYGTLYEVLIFDILQRYYGEDLDLTSRKGFLKTPEYIQFMSAPSGQCFNYSDTYSKVKGEIALWWFAEVNKDMSLIYDELRRIEEQNYSYSEDWLLPLLPIFASRLNDIESVRPAHNVWHGTGRTPVYVYRSGWDKSSDCYLGIKGGSASTSHAHMDAGSFIYERGGIRWAEDLGGLNYTLVEKYGINIGDQTQNSSRWKIMRVRNDMHNTLTIDSGLHKVDGYAKFVQTIEQDKMNGAVVDLSNTLKGIEYAFRRLCIDEGGNLICVDSIKSDHEPHELLWTMITKCDATIENPTTIRLTRNDVSMTLSIKSRYSVKPFIYENKSENEFDIDDSETKRIGFSSSLPQNTVCVFSVELSAE